MNSRKAFFNTIIDRWKENKCRGICIMPTRSGKTLLTLDLIQRFLEKNPGRSIIIAVPSKSLQYQWYNILIDKGYYGACRVYTIPYIINNIQSCDILIVDEVHTSVSDEYINLYKIKYKFFLGLTATLERLDGKHEKLLKTFPIIENLSKEEAIKNGWINNYKEYKVIIDAPDIEIYNQYEVKFQKYFRFFQQDFNLAMRCLKSEDLRRTLAEYKHVPLSMVNACTFGLNRELKNRLNFIYNHPKRIEIANKILSHRLNSKTLIFSPTIDISNKFSGYHYNSKMKEKEKQRELEEFKFCTTGVLSAVDSISMGVELNKCDLAIIVCNNSSYSEKEQKIGRLLSIRNDDIIPEVFTLVLKKTVNEEWFRLATKDNDYITITEKMLDRLLNGEEILEDRIEGPVMLNRY